MIQITYGFLLDWLDSVIMGYADGGGEVLKRLWFYSSAFAKLWGVNFGHLDSYVLFDLQFSARVHFQVMSVEETEVKGRLEVKKKTHFLVWKCSKI